MAVTASNEKVLDVAIVGGGVSGLYSGWRLLTAKAASNIELFESSHRIGGRLLSVTPPGLPSARVELGGMRFTSGQGTVKALVEYLQLATVDFPVGEPDNVAYLRGRHLTTKDLSDPEKVPYTLTAEEKKHIGDGFTVLAAQRFLKETVPSYDLKDADWVKLAREGRYEGTLLRDLPMRYVFNRSVSHEAFQFAEDTSGYDSILFTWNVADGFPWNIGDYGASIEYKRLADGYETLPRTIAKQYEEAGGKTHLHHRLVRFDTMKLPDGSDGVELTVCGPDGERKVHARKLILAMPRRSLELVEQSGAVLGPHQHEVHRLIRSVVPIPLFKLALCYRTRWWEKPGRTKGQNITDMPIRQAYYWPVSDDTKAGAILVYDDGLDLDYWAGLRKHPRQFQNQPHSEGSGLGDDEWRRHAAPELMVKEAHRQLLVMHGMEPRPELEPYAAAYRDWGDDPFGGGANFWPTHVESYDVSSRITQPIEGTPVYICGEAYSHAQGWVEGALATAEDMLQKRLGVAPPPYLQSR